VLVTGSKRLNGGKELQAGTYGIGEYDLPSVYDNDRHVWIMIYFQAHRQRY
jgi:hypothetical protein